MKTRKNKRLSIDYFLNNPFSYELVDKYIKNQSKFSLTNSNKIKNHFIKEFLKSVAYGPSIQTIELSDLLLKLN